MQISHSVLITEFGLLVFPRDVSKSTHIKERGGREKRIREGINARSNLICVEREALECMCLIVSYLPFHNLSHSPSSSLNQTLPLVNSVCMKETLGLLTTTRSCSLS